MNHPAPSHVENKDRQDFIDFRSAVVLLQVAYSGGHICVHAVVHLNSKFAHTNNHICNLAHTSFSCQRRVKYHPVSYG